jgi:MoxR-like ATPase
MSQTKIIEDLKKFNVNQEIDLLAYGSWPASKHCFDDEKVVNALKAALAAQRPLLVRGEPGTGKSQLARAAAHVLGRQFVSEVVNARSESQDLICRFDAVGRLAKAQTLKAETTDAKIKAELKPEKFISPGALWWVLDWESANRVHTNSEYQLQRPEAPDGWKPEHGSVLLIDEIDKADAELPNGLLETLGNNAVTIPWVNQTLGNGTSVPPLIIISTNEERELPAAFVRRCLVLNLKLPAVDKLEDWLVKRGELHFGERCPADIRYEAARQLLKDRKAAKDLGLTPPGQAEYLDMLRALALFGEAGEDQHVMLAAISDFALKKYPVLHGD